MSGTDRSMSPETRRLAVYAARDPAGRVGPFRVYPHHRAAPERSLRPSRPALPSRLLNLAKVHPRLGSKLLSGRLVSWPGTVCDRPTRGQVQGGNLLSRRCLDWSAKCPNRRTFRIALPLLSVVRWVVVPGPNRVRNQRTGTRLPYFTDFPWFPNGPVADVVSAARIRRI
jgi:hypothetical protein